MYLEIGGQRLRRVDDRLRLERLGREKLQGDVVEPGRALGLAPAAEQAVDRNGIVQTGLKDDLDAGPILRPFHRWRHDVESVEIEQRALAFAGLEALRLDPAAQPVFSEGQDGGDSLPGSVRAGRGRNTGAALPGMSGRLVEGELALDLPIGLDPPGGQAVGLFFKRGVRQNVPGSGRPGLGRSQSRRNNQNRGQSQDQDSQAIFFHFQFSLPKNEKSETRVTRRCHLRRLSTNPFLSARAARSARRIAARSLRPNPRPCFSASTRIFFSPAMSSTDAAMQ